MESPRKPKRSHPASFPPGEVLITRERFDREVQAEVDRLLAAGGCESGRLEIESTDARLTCLIHDSKPYLAGLLEGDVYIGVALWDLALRARQLDPIRCRLVRSDLSTVLMAAVHFASRPSLRGSVRLVDPAHVLRALAADGRNAAVAIERAGRRTLLFLHSGKPARLHFGDPTEDPGEGSLEERFLLWAFAPDAPDSTVEVFTDLAVPADPDAGASLVELDQRAQPPPPMTVRVSMHGRLVRERPFGPPMLIGRDPKVDLFIDNLGVSRRHATLSWERGAVVISDHQSSNGTFVNGERVDRATVIAGDRIEIGKFEIEIIENIEEPLVAETMMFVPPRRQRPPSRLVGDRAAVVLERDTLIGQGPAAEVRARGWAVGDVHARITRADDGTYRVSCFGRKRVRVNGRKTADAPLVNGDTLQVGRSKYRLTAAEDLPAVPRSSGPVPERRNTER